MLSIVWQSTAPGTELHLSFVPGSARYSSVLCSFLYSYGISSSQPTYHVSVCKMVTILLVFQEQQIGKDNFLLMSQSTTLQKVAYHVNRNLLGPCERIHRQAKN